MLHDERETDASFASASTTPNWSKRAAHGATATSPPNTAAGDRWSNAQSPGWSHTGHRRVRYRGVERNQLGLTMRVAAINLRRLINLGLTGRNPMDPGDSAGPRN